MPLFGTESKATHIRVCVCMYVCYFHGPLSLLKSLLFPISLRNLRCLRNFGVTVDLTGMLTYITLIHILSTLFTKFTFNIILHACCMFSRFIHLDLTVQIVFGKGVQHIITKLSPPCYLFLLTYSPPDFSLHMLSVHIATLGSGTSFQVT
jgi:hypothetical protein